MIETSRVPRACADRSIGSTEDESSSNDNAVRTDTVQDTVTLKRSIFGETDGTVSLLNALSLKAARSVSPNKSVPGGRVEG